MVHRYHISISDWVYEEYLKNIETDNMSKIIEGYIVKGINSEKERDIEKETLIAQNIELKMRNIQLEQDIANRKQEIKETHSTEEELKIRETQIYKTMKDKGFNETDSINAGKKKLAKLEKEATNIIKSITNNSNNEVADKQV